MQTRELGTLDVGAIGLGGMPMSIEGRPERDRSIRTIHAALDAGVTLIDTADAYHLGADAAGHDDVGHNESLIAEALTSYGGDTDRVLVATKGGHQRTSDGTWWRSGTCERTGELLTAEDQAAGHLQSLPLVVGEGVSR
jgi:aryl-alcohol dehydrogenase-like predicted oxidoreductase